MAIAYPDNGALERTARTRFGVTVDLYQAWDLNFLVAAVRAIGLEGGCVSVDTGRQLRDWRRRRGCHGRRSRGCAGGAELAEHAPMPIRVGCCHMVVEDVGVEVQGLGVLDVGVGHCLGASCPVRGHEAAGVAGLEAGGKVGERRSEEHTS